MDAIAISYTDPSFLQAARATDTNRSQNSSIQPVAIETNSASIENPVDEVVPQSSEENSDTYTYNSKGEIQHPPSSRGSRRRMYARV